MATDYGAMALYLLKPGDNPSKVARKFGIPLADLMAWNRLTEASARRLKVGQPLFLRNPTPPPPEKAGGPVVGRHVGRGQPPFPYSPNPVPINLPRTDPYSPLPGTGPADALAGKATVQTVMTEVPKDDLRFNPTTQREGEAAALVKKKEWTAGDEGEARPQVSIPVEVVTPEPEPRVPISGLTPEQEAEALAEMAKRPGAPWWKPKDAWTRRAMRDAWALLNAGSYGLPGVAGFPRVASRGVVRMVDDAAPQISDLARRMNPHGLVRDARGRFMRPVGAKSEPRLGKPKRPPVRVDERGKFVRGEWPGGVDPNKVPPAGARELADELLDALFR